MSGGKRVTDLDKFALEEVWRPYQSMMGHEKRLERLPMSLDDTAALLRSDQTGWADLVLDRVRRIGFTFPAYIHSPLVDVVKGLPASPASPDREGLEGWRNLTCDEQFALAKRIASNIGYVLTEEPEYPDNPHARADRDGLADRLRSLIEFLEPPEGSITEASIPSSACKRYAADLRALLSLFPPLSGGGGEPVAYRWRHRSQGAFWRYEETNYRTNVEVQPLYAAPTIPEGWVMAPKEADEAMIAAGSKAYYDPANARQLHMVYRAMLSALPAPPGRDKP